MSNQYKMMPEQIHIFRENKRMYEFLSAKKCVGILRSVAISAVLSCHLSRSLVLALTVSLITSSTGMLSSNVFLNLAPVYQDHPGKILLIG